MRLAMVGGGCYHLIMDRKLRKKPKQTSIREALPVVAVNILVARGRRGLKQSELAEMAGTSVRTIGRIEAGEIPGVVILGKIATALKTTIEALDPSLDTPNPTKEL